MNKSQISLTIFAVVSLLVPPCMAQSVVGSKIESKATDTYLSAVRSLSSDAVLICTSKDGQFAAVADDQEIVVLDLIDGSIAKKLVGHGFAGRHSATFSADNRYLFTSCFDTNPIDTDAAMSAMNEEEDTLSSAQKEQRDWGNRIMSRYRATENHAVFKWNLKTGEVVDRLPIAKGAKAGGVVMSPNADEIAYVMHTSETTSLRLHSFGKGNTIRDISLGDIRLLGEFSLTYSSDGRNLIACSYNSLVTVSIQAGAVIHRIDALDALEPGEVGSASRCVFGRAMTLPRSTLVTYQLSKPVRVSVSEICKEYERRGQTDMVDIFGQNTLPGEMRDSPFVRRLTVGILHFGTNPKTPTVHELSSQEYEMDEATRLLGNAANGLTQTNVMRQSVFPIADRGAAHFCVMVRDEKRFQVHNLRVAEERLEKTDPPIYITPHSEAERQIAIIRGAATAQVGNVSHRNDQAADGIPGSDREDTGSTASTRNRCSLLKLSDSRRYAAIELDRQVVVFDCELNKSITTIKLEESYPQISSPRLRLALKAIHKMSISIDEENKRLFLGEPIYPGITGIYTKQDLSEIKNQYAASLLPNTNLSLDAALFAEIVSATPQWKIHCLSLETGILEAYAPRIEADELAVSGDPLVSGGCILILQRRNEIQFEQISGTNSQSSVLLAKTQHQVPVSSLLPGMDFEEQLRNSRVAGFINMNSISIAAGPGQAEIQGLSEPLELALLNEQVTRRPFECYPVPGQSAALLCQLPTGKLMQNAPFPEFAVSQLSLNLMDMKLTLNPFAILQRTSMMEDMLAFHSSKQIAIDAKRHELASCNSIIHAHLLGEDLSFIGDNEVGKYFDINCSDLGSARFIRRIRIPVSLFANLRCRVQSDSNSPTANLTETNMIFIKRLLGSPDGQKIAFVCADEDHSLIIVDANSGNLVRSIQGVNGAEFLSDQRVLADDLIIDVLSGEIVSRLNMGPTLEAVPTESMPVRTGDMLTDAAASATKGSWLWFVGVGANEYDEFSKLDFAEKDLEAVGNAVAGANVGRFARVEKRLLTGADAGLREVRDSLTILEKATKRGDTVVLMFSGHGLTALRGLYLALPSTRTAELQGTALNWTDVAESVSRMEASRIVIILDACHSGAFAEANLAIQKELGQKLASKKGLIILSASQGNEVALEVESAGHGACTVGILELLKDANSHDPAQRFRLNRWKQTLATRVSELTADRQHPEWPVSNVPDDGDMFFEPLVVNERKLTSEPSSSIPNKTSPMAPHDKEKTLLTAPLSGFLPVFVADRDLLARKALTELSSWQSQRLSIYREFETQSKNGGRVSAFRERLRKSAPSQLEYYRGAATEEVAAFAEVLVPEAMHELAIRYLEGTHGVKKDPAKCAELCQSGMEQNYHPAIHTLGYCLEAGVGVGKDEAAARQCFERAAAMGNSCSMAAFGKVLLAENGDSSEKLTEAVSMVRRSAELGCESGQYQLGTVYLSGTGVPQSTETGIFWLKKSAERNSVEGMMALGKLYSDGLKVPKNLALAIDYYRKAKAAGNTEAVERLKELGLP